MEPEIISNCERPGCGKSLTHAVFVIDGQRVCHRHTLTPVAKPPPTLAERLKAFKTTRAAVNGSSAGGDL